MLIRCGHSGAGFERRQGLSLPSNTRMVLRFASGPPPCTFLPICISAVLPGCATAMSASESIVTAGDAAEQSRTVCLSVCLLSSYSSSHPACCVPGTSSEFERCVSMPCCVTPRHVTPEHNRLCYMMPLYPLLIHTRTQALRVDCVTCTCIYRMIQREFNTFTVTVQVE